MRNKSHKKMSDTTKPKLGDKVKHRVNGFIGIVTGRTEWLYGCVGLTVQSQQLKDGKPIESVCYDEDSWEVVVDQVHKETSQKTTGGPVTSPVVMR